MRLSLLAALLLVAPLHAQQYTPLQQRMSAAEFRAAGLDRLSPEQLHALDGWLQAHPQPPATRVVDSSGKPVFYPTPKDRQKFEAHIVGTFTGWSGQDEYLLDNGQRWKQNGSTDALCNHGTNPQVKLTPSLFGGWLMYVHGCNGDAHVERVK